MHPRPHACDEELLPSTVVLGSAAAGALCAELWPGGGVQPAPNTRGTQADRVCKRCRRPSAVPRKASPMEHVAPPLGRHASAAKVMNAT